MSRQARPRRGRAGQKPGRAPSIPMDESLERTLENKRLKAEGRRINGLRAGDAAYARERGSAAVRDDPVMEAAAAEIATALTQFGRRLTRPERKPFLQDFETVWHGPIMMRAHELRDAAQRKTEPAASATELPATDPRVHW